MGILQRMSMIFRAKADRALDRAEDPRETLDYSYKKQLELLQKVRRGVADVATSRKRIEVQMSQLSGQGANLQGEEEKLTLAAQRLQAKVESFRTKKETIKASYTAAEAQTRIGEAFSGISEEMSDVGMAVQRAEDKTATMQARAGAIDELLASGALEDPTGTAKDDITLELDRLASTSDVELELARMKQELTAGTDEAPREIEGQAPPTDEQESPQTQQPQVQPEEGRP